MKKLAINIILISVCFAGVKAQNVQPSDMLRYSQTYPWGTARGMGMGGAFGALGADQTSLSINPAGIGVYRSSDLSLTLSFNDNYAKSSLVDSRTGVKTNASDFSDRLKIGNLGYIYTYNTNKDQGWITASFGFAYNRLNDFDRTILIKNPNAGSSYLDEFNYYANNQGRGALSRNNLNEFYEWSAWQTALLDTGLYGPGWYNTDFSISHNYGQDMRRVRHIKGGIGEYAFSLGTNYSNKLYLGATIGIQSLIYEETTDHIEQDLRNNIPHLSSFTFTQYLNTYGTGYNFKIGVIYKPVNLLRIGLAVHTPTYYNLNSDFHTSMYAHYDPSAGGANPYYESGSRTANNGLLAPWKFIGSLAIQLGQFGIISADYERLNYSKMRLYGDDVSYQNDTLSSIYKAVNNIRVGAEGKIGPIAIRAGFGYYETPYKNTDLKNINYQTYSAGIGYRGKSFYMDLAYVSLHYSESYLLYQYVESEGSNMLPTWSYNPNIADIKHDLSRFVATVGFRF